MNLRGIKSKILVPEFIDLIKSNDVFICLESKTDDLDVINLPDGYSYIAKHRKSCRKKSGGIIVIYKNTLKSNMCFVSSDSEFVQRVKFLNTPEHNQTFLLGCVYIPPANSKYSTIDAFDEIEYEFISFQDNTNYGALIGDFNSRTSVLQDYFIPNENLMYI